MLENHFQENEFKKDSPTILEETLGLDGIELKLANLNLNVTQDNVDNKNANEDIRTDVNSNQDLGVLNLLEDKSNPLLVSAY